MSQTTQHRWMRPVRAEDFEELVARAKADDHELAPPTHVFTKDGEIVGSIALGNIPLALPWFDTRRCRAADTLYFVNQCENLLAHLMPPQNPGLVCVPFAVKSQLHPFIERLGYRSAGPFSVCFKQLK